MEEIKQNRMAVEPMKKLFWKMGIPMIVSLVLQALYNVIDSIFVANMREVGAMANEALTIAFPIQILIIAIGVGTGVGLNAMLSKYLGENDREKVNRTAGNGIFLALLIYVIFLIFGLFGSEWFIGLFTDRAEILEMGTSYLRICTCLCLGATGYTIYERFLQATGKGFYSMIAQVTGAILNILLDYILIFPCNMGVEGAAWATVIGQFASLLLAMLFHYTCNREIKTDLGSLKPSWKIIREIYKIGASAAMMQGLLSVMMAGVNAILGTSSVDSTVLVGSFGIYYKVQQIALFSAFGLSNTMITVLSFNYGGKSKERSADCIRYGVFDTLLTALLMTVLFEVAAEPLSMLFALSQDASSALVAVCAKATRIAALGYVFMGFTVSVQGVLQALGYAGKPLLLALLRLVVFVFPTCYLFTRSPNVLDLVWWTFPIAEILTCVFAFGFLKQAKRKKIDPLEPAVTEADR